MRITVEGKVFEELVLPEKNLQYSFAWDKENVYKQPVYGRTVAIGEFWCGLFVFCFLLQSIVGRLTDVIIMLQ